MWYRILYSVSLTLCFFVSLPAVASATHTDITGYAWSDTVGWISLNCLNEGSCESVAYGLQWHFHSNAGEYRLIKGYAWSEHVGWLSAESDDLVGCPGGGDCKAYISNVTGKTRGWLRAIAHEDPQAGGWDGWVSLNGSTYQPMYSGPLNIEVDGTTGTLSGWAWASDVMGWINFGALISPTCSVSNQCTDAATLEHTNSDCTVTTSTCAYAAYGYGCSSGACLTPPSPGPGGTVSKGIITLPRLVRAGNSTKVIWDVTNANASTCTVTGSNGDMWTGLASSGASGKTSGPINAQTTYLLHCDGAIPGYSYDAQTTVNITPTYREY